MKIINIMEDINLKNIYENDQFFSFQTWHNKILKTY